MAEDADPLLHNKLAFIYLSGEVPPEEFRSLRELALRKKGSRELDEGG
jgi:hypothetical protein